MPRALKCPHCNDSDRTQQAPITDRQRQLVTGTAAGMARDGTPLMVCAKCGCVYKESGAIVSYISV